MTVVVTVGDESHSANNQDAPEVHSKAAIILVGRNHTFQYPDNLVPQLNVCPYVLHSQEQMVDVISGLEVEGDDGDINLPQLHLWVGGLAHEKTI